MSQFEKFRKLLKGFLTSFGMTVVVDTGGAGRRAQSARLPAPLINLKSCHSERSEESRKKIQTETLLKISRVNLLEFQSENYICQKYKREMFVESMTFEELRREFEKDKLSLISKVHFHSAKVIKHMRKTNMSTLDKYYEYVSPRKNRFVYHFMVKSPKRDDFGINVYAYFFTKRSYAVIIYSITTDRLIYCTSHVFTRYYQRNELDNDIVHDIIRKFMSDEHITVTHPLKPMGNGVWQAFIQMNTGVALGYLHKHLNLVELRTFITNDMLKGEQVELSKQLEEKFKIHVVRKAPDQ